jgi:hypothetical protein
MKSVMMPGRLLLLRQACSLWPFVGAVIAGTLLIGGCAGGGSSEGSVAPSSSVDPTSSASLKVVAKAVDACDNRQLASGDIYVRMITPGVQAQAQGLGGEWRWDSATNKCLTSVQLVIATAPLTAGSCTQVGYVSDNPGYDPNATPAKPLKHVIGQAGPAC